MACVSRFLGLLGPALLAVAGCGPSLATVHGQVTVNGVPLKSGVISYVDAEGSAPPITMAIANGAYRLQTLPGKKLVQISAPVVVGQRKEYNGPDAPLMDITAESLPDRYHRNSELTFDVKPGDNPKDWILDTKAR